MSRNYQIKKREIDALLENFDWETNPEWRTKLIIINNKISSFWQSEIQR